MFDVDLHRPGLALTGFTDVFCYERVQVVGTSEWTYLESVGQEKRQEIFRTLKEFRSPAWILTHGLTVHEELLQLCEEQQVPIMVSSLNTSDFFSAAKDLLESWFSPYCTIHGTLVDVYGIGMLYTGSSGIGKSECALDLIERGHRLVTDDMVKLVRSGSSIVGSGNKELGHHMEIRGIGIIDVGRLFGIRAIREKKKVEMVVELQQWQQGVQYDRTGLDEQTTDLMGVSIPKKIIPISPGKNITVISEVIAMTRLLKLHGVDSAQIFNQRMMESIRNTKNRSKVVSNIHCREVHE